MSQVFEQGGKRGFGSSTYPLIVSALFLMLGGFILEKGKK